MAMSQPQAEEHEPFRMTESEYLDFEDKSEIRHEYVNGKVYAMAGAEWEHVMICQSASSALYAQLRGKNCKVGTSDLRLKVESKKAAYRYPDVMVICGDPNFIDNRKIIDNPTLIIEVLSSSTALKDRNAKLEEYTRLNSLQDYLLISQDEAKVEIFSRHESGKWLYDSVRGLDSNLALSSIGCTLALVDVYEQISLGNQNNDPESSS